MYLLVLLTLVLTLQRTLPQRIPARKDDPYFHFKISKTEIFYDTKLLPDGHEVTAFQFQGEESKYFFVVEADNTPLSIFVTPCASTLEWKIVFRNLPYNLMAGDNDDLDEEYLTDQQNSQFQATTQSDVILTNNTDDRPLIYTTDLGKTGLYIIKIKALNRDSSLKLFVTTTPYAEQTIPSLPSRHQVDIEPANRDSVLLSWNPSPSDNIHGEPIEYCLSMNKRKNFQTSCAARTYVFGDSPPTLPSNVGFGFTWETDRRSELRKKSAPLEPAAPGDGYIVCIGNKTRYLISKLKASTDYYFDVFATNKLTNRSITYTGAKFRTKPPKKYFKLKKGKVFQVQLKKSYKDEFFSYMLSNHTNELIFSIQPCPFGKIHIQLFRKRKLLKTMEIQDFKVLILHKPKLGRYYIKVSNNKKRPKNVKISVSTSFSSFPYPTLPKETRLKIFENLVSCNSITVAWMGTSERQTYCLYVGKGTSSLQDIVSTRDQCLSPELRNKSNNNEKLFCRLFRAKNKRRSVMTKTITGLEPGQKYIINVYVKNKTRQETLSYQAVVVRTKRHCIKKPRG